MVKLSLIAEFDGIDNSAAAQRQLDLFRESCLPSQEWGITLYRDEPTEALKAAAEKALAYITNVNAVNFQDVIDTLCDALGIPRDFKVEGLAAPLVQTRVIAFVEGGLVSAARSSTPVDFDVLDLDNWSAEDREDQEAMARYEALEAEYDALTFAAY